MDRFLDLGLDGADQEMGIIILCACAYVIMMWMTGRNDITEPIPREIRNMERGLYLRRVMEYSDTNCINMFRMDRELFFNLSGMLRNRGLLQDSDQVTVEEQLGIFLYTIGHNVRNRVVGMNFLRSGETVSRYFQRTLRAIGELRWEYLCGPSNQTHEKISGDPRFCNYFQVPIPKTLQT